MAFLPRFLSLFGLRNRLRKCLLSPPRRLEAVIATVKIHPNDLEDALRELADLREVAVFSATVGAGTQALCAAIVSNVPLDADAFHARCREHLRGKAPELIIYLRELPRNAAGKVMRAELERLLIAGLRARRATQ